MPLPEGTQRTASEPWPPLANRPALDKIGEWSAWYSSNRDHIETVYHRLDQRLTGSGLKIRPSQYSGGIRGWVARTFWGSPPSPGEPRSKLHIPLPADIATVSAGLLFAEPITIKHPDKVTNDKLTGLLDDTLHATLIESAEVTAGLGGSYLRAVWDRDVYPDGPWLGAIHADAAIPTWSYGRLAAVTFWRVLAEKDQKVVRWLERHEKGAIFHAVYEGTPDKLGRRIPLTEFPDTRPLAALVVDGDRLPTGTDLLTTQYVPNMRPNKLWRNDVHNAPLGRSDYDGIEGIFDMLDETYSSWLRDIRNGKGRVFVPSVYLESQGPGKGGRWDPERQIYEALNMLPNDEAGSQLTVAQFEIRVEEHQMTAADLTRKAVGTAGYSGQSFGMANEEGDAPMTATETNARKGRSLSTRDHKILYWRPAIRYMMRVFAEIGRSSFGWKTSGDVAPEVIFPEAVQPDPRTVAETLQLLDAARAISVETKVEKANPDRVEDRTWIQAETKRILDENAMGPLEDPGTFRGGGPVTVTGPKPADKPAGAGEKEGE